jgi:hypothetical protein
VWDIAGFYRESSRDALLRLAREDKDLDIRSAAIGGLGAYQTAEVRDELFKALRADSYRALVPEGALTAIFARGLDTLAWLARNEEKKELAREFLVTRVNSARKRVQQSALAGLGTLGDPKSIAVLEKFASLPKEAPERATAEKSLTALRDAKKPAAELGTLRGDVLKLQQENKDLRKEFDELKKKLDAAGKSAPTKGPKK